MPRKHLGATNQVFTASYQGWAVLKNGELLRAAEDDCFDVLVTGDRSLCFEQNLKGRRIAVVALSCIEWRIVRDHLAKVVSAIDAAQAGSFQEVQCGLFERGGPSDPVPV